MPVIGIPLVFLGLSVLFAVLAIRDYSQHDYQLTVAGKNWRRMAIIFVVVAAFLLLSRQGT